MVVRWALAPVAATALLFVVRTALEDRALREEFSGYEEYAARTRHRLPPGVWWATFGLSLKRSAVRPMNRFTGDRAVQLVSYLCLGIFGIVSLVVGLRLLRLWVRTRRLPEFLIGLCFLAGGVPGRGVAAIGDSAESLPEALRAGLYMGGRFLLVICCLSVALLAWRVFQRDRAWAKGLFLLLLATLAIHSVVHISVTPPGAPLAEGIGAWMGIVARTGAFVWVSWEALRYSAMLRRRVSVGLADPVVANRIALWGVAAGLIAFLFLVTPLAEVVAGTPTKSPALMMTQGLVGLVVAVCIALAFFPPRAYLRWIEARAAQQEC